MKYRLLCFVSCRYWNSNTLVCFLKKGLDVIYVLWGDVLFNDWRSCFHSRMDDANDVGRHEQKEVGNVQRHPIVFTP